MQTFEAEAAVAPRGATEHIVPKVSPKEFARLWGVSTMTVYRALHTGQIPGATKARQQWRIPVDAQIVG